MADSGQPIGIGAVRQDRGCSMRHFTLHASAAGAFVVLTLQPALAGADTISFRYSVQIESVCDLDLRCFDLPVGAPRQFPLVLAFDNTITSSTDQSNFHARAYGLPQFSDPPLPRPPLSPSVAVDSWTREQATLLTGAGWLRLGQVGSVASVETNDFRYVWRTDIFKFSEFLPTAPELSPTSLGSFLSGGAFSYSYYGQSLSNPDLFSPDSITYSGTATLQDAAPIPEPASLLLVGTGAGAMGLSRLRRRRRERGR